MTAATEIRPFQPGAPAGRPTAVSQATAIEQSRAIAEVQAAVVVAQNCPRDMAAAEREMEYVCGRLTMAERAFYQVTNRGTGASVHLMRELARIWGNTDYGVKELHRNDAAGESEVQAFAWDIQKNTRSSRTFIVPHQRMVKIDGKQQRKDLVDLTDIYLNNQNVGARAVRECIDTILPRWFVEKAQDICHETLRNGEGKPLRDRIDALVTAFDGLGVTLKQLEARVGRERGTWTPEDVAQLTVAGQSIRRGEAQRDDLFPPIEATTSTADEIATAAPAKEGDPAAPGKKPARARKSSADKARQQLEADVVAAAQKADAEEKAAAEQGSEPPPADPGDVDGEATANAAEAAEQNADTPPPADPEPTSDHPEPASKRERTKVGEAAERRLFLLLGQVHPPLTRDDRILVYRHILDNPDINSTNDIESADIGKLCDQLYNWAKFEGTVLNDRIRDILNAADIAAENAKGGDQS
ncbi:MAG: hypothetical protein AB1925_12690 [Actinomycetota bacterium]